MTLQWAVLQREPLKALGYLYGILEAGEKGYTVAAANLNNRGLKLIFRSYGRQRQIFKAAILSLIRGTGSDYQPGSSIPAMIHRGRIDIFAALTIGDENMERTVLREMLFGEKVALKTCVNTLKKELPPETREIVAGQFEMVRQQVGRIRLMLGDDGKRQVLRLYDSEADAGQAIEALESAGFSGDAIEQVPMPGAIDLYGDRGSTIFETVLSGATGGALWGAVNGAVAGLTMPQFVRATLESPTLLTMDQIRALTALACIAGGAFVGAMIGLFIGWGISSGDRYLFDQPVRRGQSLVKLTAPEQHASAAWAILRRVDLESLAGGNQVLG